MLRRLPFLQVAVFLLVPAWSVCPLHAQQLPSAPVPVLTPGPSGEGVQRPADQIPSQPRTVTPPPVQILPPPAFVPPAYAPYQDNNGPLLVGDPLIDRLHCPPPGWFGALELDLLAPHIKNRLQAPLQLDGFEPNLVHLPTAPLEWTGSPQIDLGYRFWEGLGELMVSYRLLVTDGWQGLAGFDIDGGDGILRSRLSVNSFDFDYASREYSLDPHWDMKWRAGVRLATVYFDSCAEAFFLAQKTSNHFIGAGPHVGLDLWRSFNAPGLGIFTRLDAAELLGEVSQRFSESIANEDGKIIASDGLHVTSTQGIPVLSFQVGLGWVSCWHHHWSRLAIGYEFERWWQIGNAGDSSAELTDQGVFFRAEFQF